MPKTVEPTPGVATFNIDPSQIVADEDLNSRRYSTGRVEEMMVDILENGQQEPCKVRAITNGDGAPTGKYRLVFGFRRHKAVSNINAEKLHKDGPLTLWCSVVEIDDKDAFLSNVAENVQRSDLTPIDKAHAGKRMIDEFGIAQADAARRLDISNGYLSKLMAIVSNTDARVQKQVHKGDMPVETAYEVSQMEPEAQKEYLDKDAKPSRAGAKKRKKAERGPKILSGKSVARTFESIGEVEEGVSQAPHQMLAADIAKFCRGELSETAIAKRLEKYCKSRL